jgi:hypothetical protein
MATGGEVRPMSIRAPLSRFLRFVRSSRSPLNTRKGEPVARAENLQLVFTFDTKTYDLGYVRNLYGCRIGFSFWHFDLC